MRLTTKIKERERREKAEQRRARKLARRQDKQGGPPVKDEVKKERDKCN